MKLKPVTPTRQDRQLMKDVETGSITSTDYTVYNVLAFLIGYDKDTDISYSRLAGACHLSVVTLRKSLRRLNRAGWINMATRPCPYPLRVMVYKERTIMEVD